MIEEGAWNEYYTSSLNHYDICLRITFVLSFYVVVIQKKEVQTSIGPQFFFLWTLLGVSNERGGVSNKIGEVSNQSQEVSNQPESVQPNYRSVQRTRWGVQRNRWSVQLTGKSPTKL